MAPFEHTRRIAGLGQTTFDALGCEMSCVLACIEDHSTAKLDQRQTGRAHQQRQMDSAIGDIANNDPAFEIPLRIQQYGFVRGENVIYLGGSFDTDLAS